MAGVTDKTSIVLWLLGGTGVILIYAAYKNISPQSILAHYVTPATATTTLTGDSGNTQMQNRTSGDSPVLDALRAGTQMQNRTSAPSPNLDRLRNSVRRDDNGIAYLYNSDGLQLNTLPAAYQTNPETYLPARAIFA